MTKRGIFVGLSTIDMIHTVDEYPAPNTKIVSSGQELVAGGPATNAAITFGYLGGEAIVVSAVGRHPLATVVKEDLRRHAVDLVDLMPESDDLPPVSSVWVNRLGQRTVVSVNATQSRIPASEVQRGLLQQSSVVLVDGHLMEACCAWASAAKKAGVPVVFDGGSWKPGTEQLLPNVTVAICSEDFLPTGCKNSNEVIASLRTYGIENVAITHGSAPVQFASPASSGLIEVPKVNAVDTTGAGDVFHGAFCFYLATGLTFVDALREAATVASESCRFPGTRGWMQVRSDR